MTDREVYDLCRKYKHYYKKYKDVKSWNGKYHDIDLSDAVLKTKIQLNDVTDELLISLFREYGVCCMNMEANYDYPIPEFDSRGFVYCSSMGNSTTNLEIHNSNRFIKCLSDYMMEWRSHNYVKL